MDNLCKLYGASVVVHKGEYPSSDIIHAVRWEGFKLKQFIKWEWYFRYRAALFQVENPRSLVLYNKYHHELTEKAAEEIRREKASRLQAKITKWQNKLNKAVAGWSELFPIEDEPVYQKFVAKLAQAKIDREEFLA